MNITNDRWKLLILAALVGCRSPEEGRPRGGGAGGDGGNYPAKPVHAPSKIDGTKAIPDSLGGPTP